MYGSTNPEALRAFKADVQREVNAAVERVAAKHGLGGQVLVIDGAGNAEGEQALQTLGRIKELVA